MSETSEEKPTCPECGEKHTKFALLSGQDALWDCGSVRWDKRHDFKFAQSYECRGRVIASLHSTVADLTAKLAAVSKERDNLREGYNRSPVSAKACPGCVYEDGKFVRECGIHKQLCDERDRADAMSKDLAAANQENERLRALAAFLPSAVVGRNAIRDVLTELSDQEASDKQPHTHVDFDEQIRGLVELDVALAALLAPSEGEEGSDGD